MLVIIIVVGLIYCLFCFILGIAQYIKNPKPPHGMTLYEYKQYYKNREWQQLTDDESEIDDIHENERIMLLDETIVKYNKLLDNLNEQYKSTSDDKKRSTILAKQIVTLEKLNRALEKREKLD